MKKVFKSIEQQKEQIVRKELTDLCWENKEMFVTSTEIDDVVDFLFENRYNLKNILEKL